MAEQFADDLFEAEFNPQATKNQVRANLSDGYRLVSRRMGIENRKRSEKRRPNAKVVQLSAGCRTSTGQGATIR